MNMSRERLQNSRKIPKFWWFHGKDLVDFFKEVEEEGAENVRVIVTPGLDEDGRPDLHLSVEPENAPVVKEHHEYNVSHPCPPDCPD